VAVSADARWVVTDAHGRFHLWDTTTGQDVSPSDRHSDRVGAVRLSADGSRIVTASRGDVIVWDAPSGRLLHKLTADGFLREQTLALSPDGERLACVRRREPPDGRGSPTDSLIVCAWRSGDARIWGDGVTSVAWSADGESVILGTGEGEVWTLDLRTGSGERLLDGVVGGVQAWPSLPTVASQPSWEIRRTFTSLNCRADGRTGSKWERSPFGSPLLRCFRVAFLLARQLPLILTVGCGHVCRGGS
jgi:WD40 repeat protein